MKLSTIKVEKFRGIRSAAINVGTELALVGQNSGGKSSILRALNAFFNFEEEREHFEAGRHKFQKTSTALIELEFSGAPEQCTLPRITAGSDSVKLRLKYKKSDVWEVHSNGSWVGAPANFMESLKEHVRYVYIPVARNEHAFSFGQPNVLEEAVSSWVKDYIRNRDRLSPKVTEATTIIKDRTFKGLSKHLRDLTHLSGDFKFEIDYATPPDYNLLIRNLVLRVVEGGTSVNISDCGSGTQSLAAIGLYSYLAEALAGTYILGIEEPEQNLHPQAQRSLVKSFKSLPLQVLFTTHSTVMIDCLTHEEVALCRRKPSARRGFEITVTQLSGEFWERHDVNREKYYTFYRRRNSEFFFADFVILTESPIDSELVRYLIEQSKAVPTDASVSLVSLDGVDSLPYAYHLLRELKINFVSIVDKDYFLPYLNDELKESRDARGFPRYRKEYKRGCLIDAMVPAEQTRLELLELFQSNHSSALELLANHGVICFRYSMDIDLVGSNAAKAHLYALMGIPEPLRNSREILENHRNQLKKQEAVLSTVRSLKPSELPNSYKKIRKRIPEMIRASCKES